MDKNKYGDQEAEPILFSIIMPTYNRAGLIGNAIESVLGQTYSNFELIIVNDGGCDNTVEVIKSFGDPRIKYFWKENERMAIARNFGFLRASGDYIGFLDDDDVLYPHHLTTALDLIRKHQSPEVVYVHYNIVDENHKIIANPQPIRKPLKHLLVYKNPISNNGIFLRKDLTEKYKYSTNKELKLSTDWLLWLQISSNHTIHYTNKVTHGVVAHQARSSASAGVNTFTRNKELFLEVLRNDVDFMRDRKWGLRYISAYYDTYIALFLSIQGYKWSTMRYFLSGIFTNPAELFRRRTLAIIKYFLLRW